MDDRTWRRLPREERNRLRHEKHARRNRAAIERSAEDWKAALSCDPVWLNLGGRFDCDPNRPGWWSIDKRKFKDRMILHDLRRPLPIPDGSVDRLMTEHFLEHIRIPKIEQLFREAYRVLKPGCLFRVAVPDYNHPKHQASREAGYDVGEPHHVTLWDIDMARRLVDESPFTEARFLHYWDAPNGNLVTHEIDHSLAWIRRVPENDKRNNGRKVPPVTSLVFDLWKDAV